MMKMTTAFAAGILLCAALRASAAGTGAALATARSAAPAPAAAAGPRLPAGGVKAASVAMADFGEHLQGLAEADDMRPWMQALKNVENYQMEISRDGAAWVVRFFPALKNLQSGEDVRGGAEYRVDAASYRIVDHVFWK